MRFNTKNNKQALATQPLALSEGLVSGTLSNQLDADNERDSGFIPSNHM